MSALSICSPHCGVEPGDDLRRRDLRARAAHPSRAGRRAARAHPGPRQAASGRRAELDGPSLRDRSRAALVGRAVRGARKPSSACTAASASTCSACTRCASSARRRSGPAAGFKLDVPDRGASPSPRPRSAERARSSKRVDRGLRPRDRRQRVRPPAARRGARRAHRPRGGGALRRRREVRAAAGAGRSCRRATAFAAGRSCCSSAASSPARTSTSCCSTCGSRSRRACPDARLLIAGGGPLLSDLRRRAGELGLGERVAFTGYVPEAEKADHFNLADVFVFPSALEGFGLAVGEAMSSGLPVVASDRGSIPELLTARRGRLPVRSGAPGAVRRGAPARSCASRRCGPSSGAANPERIDRALPLGALRGDARGASTKRTVAAWRSRPRGAR